MRAVSSKTKPTAKSPASLRVVAPAQTSVLVVPSAQESRRETQRRERREALVEAATSLFLSHGIDATTIDEIVSAAGTAKGNFYRYFRDKEELIESLSAPIAEKVRLVFSKAKLALNDAGPGEEARRVYQLLAQDLVAILIANTPYVRLYLQESRGAPVGARLPLVRLSNEFLDLATELSHVARERGLVKKTAGRLTATVTVGATEAILLRALAGDDLGPIFEVPQRIVEMVLDGIGAKI